MWRGTYCSEPAAEVEAIRDVFIFMEGECELGIEPVIEQAASVAAPTPARLPDATRSSDPAGGKGSAAASSIRVSAEKLDQLVNLVGELVTVQARLSEAAARRDDADILEVSEAVDRLTAALRENSMSIRMLPLQSHLRAVPPAGSRPRRSSCARRSSSPSKAPTRNWIRP